THAFATAHARPSLAPRPSAVVLWAFVLAYGGTSWLQVVARAEGTPEPGETVLIPWLRDATLALPLVFVGTWLGMQLTAKLLSRYGLEVSRGLRETAHATIVALTGSMMLGSAALLRSAPAVASFQHHHTAGVTAEGGVSGALAAGPLLLLVVAAALPSGVL